MVRKTKVLSLVLAFVLIMGSVAFGQPKDDFTTAVNVENTMEHIRHLSQEVGTRPGGLDGEWEGALYIKSIFESYGYDVELQPFAVKDQYIGKVIFEDESEWEMGSMTNTLISDTDVIEGEVVHVEKSDSGFEFASKSIEGKIVLMERGKAFWEEVDGEWNYNMDAINEQIEGAIKADAKGVILYSTEGSRGNYGSAFTNTIGVETDIPVLGAALIQGKWLKEMAKKDEVKIKLQTMHYSNLKSLNVIATKESNNNSQKAPIVVIGGHMDSVVGAPGANDNASGVAVTLELARVLNQYKSNTEIRFIAFGSEERGLLGSDHYVSELTEQEKERIVAMFSLDMISTDYADAEYLAVLKPFITNESGEMVVDEDGNKVVEAALLAETEVGYVDVFPATFNASDHVPFGEVGIDSALFIWMAIRDIDQDGEPDTDPNTGFPVEYIIEKVYHTPQDTIEENISKERLKSALDIITSAVSKLIDENMNEIEKTLAPAS